MLTSSSPYDVMDIPHTSTDSEIKSSYRKKSVLIHPDKCKHEKAEEVSSVLLPQFIVASFGRYTHELTLDFFLWTGI